MAEPWATIGSVITTYLWLGLGIFVVLVLSAIRVKIRLDGKKPESAKTTAAVRTAKKEIEAMGGTPQVIVRTFFVCLLAWPALLYILVTQARSKS